MGSRFWWTPKPDGGEPASPPRERRIVALLAPATFFEGYDNLILGLALPPCPSGEVGLRESAAARACYFLSEGDPNVPGASAAGERGA